MMQRFWRIAKSEDMAPEEREKAAKSAAFVGVRRALWEIKGKE